MKYPLNNSIDWQPKTQPLLTLTGLATKKKIILRNDNNEPLAIISDSYRLFTKRELEKLCNGVEKIRPYKIEGDQEYRNGKFMLGTAQDLCRWENKFSSIESLHRMSPLYYLSNI